MLSYTYNASQPTPAAGGASFNLYNSGAHDQHKIEQRPDVLLFTSTAFDSQLLFVGAPTLTVRVWASARSVDIVGRLCLVSERGVSTNLAEGLTRVDAAADEKAIGDADGGSGRLVTVELSPVAAELSRGQRLRLHVCSSAHPRWMRNLLASPEVPIARKRSTSPASCIVRLLVDSAEGGVTLPIIDEVE